MTPRANALQFAVVREDPAVEAEIFASTAKRAALLIGSGGCTAFTLRQRFPDARLTLVEPNPAQIESITTKARLLHDLAPGARDRAFGVGRHDPAALTQNGNFESLFRTFRQFVHEFVLPYEGWRAFFSDGGDLSEVFDARYWPVAFELFFADTLLRAMFGPAAVQYATPGSYPNYFRGVFERGLRRPDARDNYFLHHVLLGHYLEKLGPTYIGETFPENPRFEVVPALAQDAPTFAGFDLVSLSNICDWMSPAEVETLGARVAREMDPGATLVLRQLNNDSDVRRAFPGVRFDDARAAELHARDRSLFYSHLHIGQKETLK